MKYLLTAIVFFMISGSAAYAGPPTVPSPEMDFGLASVVMAAGAAFLAARRRR